MCKQKGLRDILHRYLLGPAGEQLRTDRKPVDLQNSGNQLIGKREACPQFAIESVFSSSAIKAFVESSAALGERYSHHASDCSDSRELYFL
jgi:hypothetical protein